MEMANEKRELTELRAEIIKLDDAIVELLDARANISQRIGEVKRQLGLSLIDHVRLKILGILADIFHKTAI
jgi:chorismate mutase